jgi:hypothetical protein
MNKPVLLLLSVLSLAAPACVVHTTAPRDVGSLNADGSVFLGWHLFRSSGPGGVDREVYDVGQQLGNFQALRLHADRPVEITQVLVIFADGERWMAPAQQVLDTNQWSAWIPLPRAPRPIHSVEILGRSTSAMLANVDVHGLR